MILLPFVVYRHRRGAVPMIVAGAAAVVAYLPWLPNVFGTVHALGNDRASYLEADPNFFKEEFFSVLGFNGQGIYFASPLLSPWDRWSAFHPLFWALSLGGIALGGWALMRHRFAVTLAFALLIGTLVAAYLFSQISPGFAPRTVSYAVLGWAILLGAAAAGGGISISRRVIGWVVVVAMVVVSAASLQAESQGHKQDWRSWATGVADAAHLGYPIVYFPSLAATFADAYQPGSLSGAHFEVDQVTDLSGLGSFVNGQQAFWFASTDLPERVTLDPFFRSQGFERALSHQYPADLLSLDLYVRSGVNLGSPLAIDEGFTQTTGKALGWQLPTGRSSISPGAGGPELTLSNPGGIEVSALLTIPGSALHLYSLTLEARSRLASGSLRAFLVCEGGGEALSLAPDQAGANVPADSSWHTISFSTFCPDGSDEVRVDLRDAGVGDLDLRGVEIYEAAPAWHG